MHNMLVYPFDSKLIIQKKKKIRRELLSDGRQRIKKRIAILGGSTTSDIKDILELFLLNYDIEPEFYESEYGKYWEDAVFDNEQLAKFEPDIIFIHTTNRNIRCYDHNIMSDGDTSSQLDEEYLRYERMWTELERRYNATIIQNNFELPLYRLYGNQDCCSVQGQVYLINRLNQLISSYAMNHDNFFVHDINYLSATYGLEQWYNLKHWYMYKYAFSVSAIPLFSYSLANIVKSIYGKNKKLLMLDLDNTIWGGIIGEDGSEGIELGEETPIGQAYREFQSYIKKVSETGVVLAVNSKNDYMKACTGLNHPMGILKEKDFAIIMANWNNKDENTEQIAERMGLGIDSFVFVDDNPVEREWVSKRFPEIAVPKITSVETAINTIDKAGYFEKTIVSAEDISRNEMYKSRSKRIEAAHNAANYNEYLLSLNMEAHITRFEDIYIKRITQLVNKTNQFNLTTKRYSETDIKKISRQDNTICMYGKLKDKYGDEGIVSIAIGIIEGDMCRIDIWLMSCRVLKRGMEYAMMDTFVSEAKKSGVKTIIGYYYKTAKNEMVSQFYEQFGFKIKSEEKNGDSVWILDVPKYEEKNLFIKVVNDIG